MRLPTLRLSLFSGISLLICAYAQISKGAGPVNGFEVGDPPITSSGDVSIVTGSFQSDAPPQGTRQLVLTTIQTADAAPDNAPVSGTSASTNAQLTTFFNGINPGGLEGSGVLIPFTVATGDTLLTFQYDFLTNETVQTTPRNDFAFRMIFDGSNTLVPGSHVTFASVSSPPAAFTSFSPGSPFIAHTGFQTLQINISGLAAGSYVLGIGVEDVVTPGNVATGLVIDNVQVVPEPSTMGLALAGAVLLVAMRKRIKKS